MRSPERERCEVDAALKPREAGVARALRFCAMESSIEERETRRKSAGLLGWAREEAWNEVPLRAAVEKQNCGVRGGWGNWVTISSFALGAGGGGSFDQMRFATVKDVRRILRLCGCKGRCEVWRSCNSEVEVLHCTVQVVRI